MNKFLRSRKAMTDAHEAVKWEGLRAFCAAFKLRIEDADLDDEDFRAVSPDFKAGWEAALKWSKNKRNN